MSVIIDTGRVVILSDIGRPVIVDIGSPGPSGAAAGGALLAVNNLSDLANAATARTNLGLGTAATTAASDFATAAQGALADTATQPADIATKLDDLSAGTADAIVTASADGTLLSRAAYTIATLLAAAYARASHTGTQLASTISDFTTAVQALFGTTAGTICEGDDARLSDARTPTAHDQGSDTITSTLLDVTGTTHTAAAGDDGKIYRLTNASGCTVTIPDSLSAGWSVGWLQIGNAQSTFAVSGSMVLSNRQSHTKSAGQYAAGNLTVQATNSVYLSGDTGA